VAKLPTDLSGRDVRAALERVGFVFRRQAGSHMMLRRDQPYARIVVPDHKQVRPGTLRRIIADAGLTVEHSSRWFTAELAIGTEAICGRSGVASVCGGAAASGGPGDWV
jgi:predicted RNA binding protein YcfA (HicA-like mRNA interferase family)